MTGRRRRPVRRKAVANREARRRAWRFGRRAEAAALWLLRLKGYRILARNVRLPVGELDVVARRGRLVAFIEVKARPDIGQAAAALSTRQRQRIRRAAEVFLAQHPGLAPADIRFDLLLLAPWKWPVHMADAWRD